MQHGAESAAEPTVSNLLSALTEFTEEDGVLSLKDRVALSARVAQLAAELEERLETRFAAAEEEAESAMSQLVSLQAEVGNSAALPRFHWPC